MNVDRLKGKMQERRVTQGRLAKELNVDRATIIRMFEAGEDRCSLARARKIGVFLHMTRQEMLDTFLDDYALI